MDLVIQAISLVGAVLILGAFIRLQRNSWRSDSRAYLWANFIGSSLLTAVAVWDRRIGFVLLELAWAIVSVWSIIRPARTA